MRVLHLCSSIGRYSGVMNVVMQYYNQLHNEITFDFLCWVDDEDEYSDDISKLNGKIIKMEKPSPKNYHDFKNRIDILCQRYEIIHIHEMYLVTFIYKIAKKRNCKIIAHAHTTEFSDRIPSRIRNKILCYNVQNKVDGMLACSLDSGKKYFGKKFVEKGTILPNAFDVEKFYFNYDIRAEYRKNFQVKKDEIIFFHVGRFNSQKNHKKIINVFFEFQKLNINSKLIMVGVGPKINEIKKIAHKYKIMDKVIFLKTRKDINNFFMMSDIFLFPSLFEGLGIALVEAQYSGIQSIASDVIPKEAIVSENVLQMDLKIRDSEWANQIYNLTLEKKFKKREDNQLENDLFNIKKSKNILKDYYEGLLYE